MFQSDSDSIFSIFLNEPHPAFVFGWTNSAGLSHIVQLRIYHNKPTSQILKPEFAPVIRAIAPTAAHPFLFLLAPRLPTIDSLIDRHTKISNHNIPPCFEMVITLTVPLFLRSK